MALMDNRISKCTLPRCNNWLVIKEFETSNAKAKLHLAMLRNSKQSFFARNINSDVATNSFGSEKQFWNTMKYLMKEQSTITLQSGGKCADKELDKANMLNLYFLHVSIHALSPLLAPMNLLNTWICWREL